MKGDQTVLLLPHQWQLSEAMDIHMTDSNCCGTLVYICGTSDEMYQFVCEKCHEVVQVK